MNKIIKSEEKRKGNFMSKNQIFLQIFKGAFFFVIFSSMTGCGGASGGDIGGSGGSGGSGPAPDQNAGSGVSTAASLQVCHEQEKLIAHWSGDPIADDTTNPYAQINFRFDPFFYFSATLPASISMLGTYEILGPGRIKLNSQGTTPSIQEATYQIAGNTLTITLANGQAYRVQRAPDRNDVFKYLSSGVPNPYYADGVCSLSELSVPASETTLSCSNEILHGNWYHVFPTREGEFSANVLYFDDRPFIFVGSGSPASLNIDSPPPPRFTWGYLHYRNASSTPISPFGEERVNLGGSTRLEGNRLTFKIESATLPGTTIGTEKTYTITNKPPFLILKASDNSEILLGRMMSRRDSAAEQQEEDGICERRLMTTCPAATIMGTCGFLL